MERCIPTTMHGNHWITSWFISYSLFTAITLLIALLLPVQSYLPLMKWGHDLPIMCFGSKFILYWVHILGPRYCLIEYWTCWDCYLFYIVAITSNKISSWELFLLIIALKSNNPDRNRIYAINFPGRADLNICEMVEQILIETEQICLTITYPHPSALKSQILFHLETKGKCFQKRFSDWFPLPAMFEWRGGNWIRIINAFLLLLLLGFLCWRDSDFWVRQTSDFSSRLFSPVKHNWCELAW